MYKVCAHPESVQTKQARLRPKDLSKPDHARYREENNSFIFLGAGYGFSSSLCIIRVISKKTCRKTAKHNLSNVPGKSILWFTVLAQYAAQASAFAATVWITPAILEGGRGDQFHLAEPRPKFP